MSASALPQVRNELTAPEKRILDTIGDTPITRLRIRRSPVMAFIEKFFQAITLGQWEKVKQKHGYDKFFHLALILEYKSGSDGRNEPETFIMTPSPEFFRFVVEKLELVNIARTTLRQAPPRSEYMEVDLKGREITMRQMITNARTRMGDERFFRYDAFANNCQVFVRTLLEGVGLLTPEAQAFLFQPVDKLLKDLPFYTAKVARFITDLGGLLAGVVDGYSYTARSPN